MPCVYCPNATMFAENPPCYRHPGPQQQLLNMRGCPGNPPMMYDTTDCHSDPITGKTKGGIVNTNTILILICLEKEN